jgi:hypothetical protein
VPSLFIQPIAPGSRVTVSSSVPVNPRSDTDQQDEPNAASVSLISSGSNGVVPKAVAVEIRPGAEPVQVAVGPAECGLDNVVQLTEEQVGRELQPTPGGSGVS